MSLAAIAADELRAVVNDHTWLTITRLWFAITRNNFTRSFARSARRWGPRQGPVGAADPW
jgi:hypothetical protein